MRFDPWRCPECGEAAKGTHEVIPGVALLLFDGLGGAEFLGETEVDWNGQESIRDGDGNVTLSCRNGHEWPARVEEG